ncbi:MULTISPECIES: hypothetical protein [unclassified Streptomyces]|uniref:hypothetical protein n=1 Tax=unclassified Streptomyces TaxID=2593676 RepID=UPI003D760B9F
MKHLRTAVLLGCVLALALGAVGVTTGTKSTADSTHASPGPRTGGASTYDTGWG